MPQKRIPVASPPSLLSVSYTSTNVYLSASPLTVVVISVRVSSSKALSVQGSIMVKVKVKVFSCVVIPAMV